MFVSQSLIVKSSIANTKDCQFYYEVAIKQVGEQAHNTPWEDPLLLFIKLGMQTIDVSRYYLPGTMDHHFTPHLQTMMER